MIIFRNVIKMFGSKCVLKDFSLHIQKGETLCLVGMSGAGKSVTLKHMVGLLRPTSGEILIAGEPIQELDSKGMSKVRSRFGYLFQSGALLQWLSVGENVGLPLREHTALGDALIDDIATWKIAMAGLKPEVAAQYPSELSGGMMKRASLARALALDPELLFLDEPTAGLDPESAAGVDELVLRLRDQFGLTVVMITHDLDLLWQVTDRVAVLGEGTVQGIGSMAELAQLDRPAIRPFFDGPRARGASPRSTGPTGETSSKPK